jgi:ribosomal subunit interface protein
MEVSVRSHGPDPGLDFRDFAAAKVSALAHHFAPITSAEVEFATDLKRRPHPVHVAKITLHLTGHRLPDLRAHAEGSDARVAFDLALVKLDAELVRLKEQVESH